MNGQKEILDLLREYGIESPEELNAKLRELPKINLSPFCGEIKTVKKPAKSGRKRDKEKPYGNSAAQGD